MGAGSQIQDTTMCHHQGLKNPVWETGHLHLILEKPCASVGSVPVLHGQTDMGLNPVSPRPVI